MPTKEELVNKKIGKTIAKKRKIAGFSQEEVAEHLGLGNEAVSRIERGVVAPSVYRLYEFADMFECGIETFLIEGSRRPTDQVEYMTQLLSKLSSADRQLIIATMERFAKRLARKGVNNTQREESDDSQFLL
ncbi:helix-turn-helix domain-containing protein [Collimonas arenae]|uniref:helix-turn-helix domain-containing protein n=1 Tax=Collimonas arenae TaxID=279058 RepID=UPI000690659F|nr:helix-turn-helix transcriptional regulator [Collimonas arenae]